MTNARARTRQRPVIRVFLSSTFSDLKLERDALQQRVFPKLEQLCVKDGFQFQAIDLRWGVSTEAGLDHRTMQICFEELRRSQEVSPEPNFLILLGNRYGWRPLPETISADEFQSLELAAGQTEAAGPDQSPVELLRRWYQLDENSLTPMYVLQPRRRPRDGRPGGKDYTAVDVWREVEQGLWQIINRAYSPEGLKDRFASPLPTTEAMPRIVRFQGSATEQEIWCGALSVPDASQHVLAFFRETDQSRSTGDAGQFRGFADLASGEIDPVPQMALRDLKDEIKKRLGDNAVELTAAHLVSAAESDGPTTISTDHMDELCGEVESRLTAIIERQINDYWSEPQGTDSTGGEPSVGQRTARELEIERDEHLRFGSERGLKQTYVGRKNELDRIQAYLVNDSRLPLAIRGDSGCGKTALLARAFQEIPAQKKPLIRFVGVTPRSSDLNSLLRSLCQELRPGQALGEALPSDTHELVQLFWQCLEGATVKNPVIMFLDALDQLSEADGARELFWIPSGELPINVKIVVSCLSDRDGNDPAGRPDLALRRRGLPTENIVNLDALSLADAKTLLFDRWLKTAGRTVNQAQRHLLEERLGFVAECRDPLYIKLLFEEAKLWRSYDELAEPGGSVAELLEQLCQRLSKAENHGESLVRLVFGYVAAARRGLSETEILEVLFADSGYRNELDEACQRNNYTLPSSPPRIPIAIWSRLRSDLAPYLTERAAPGGNVLAVYHRQISEWITARFVNAADWNPHARLAEFFGKQDYFFESVEEQRARAKLLPPTPRLANIRKVDELPYHLLEVAKHVDRTTNSRETNAWDGVADLLADWQFLEAKVEAQPTMVFDLAQDLADTFGAMPADHPRRHILALLGEAIRHDLQFIDRHPTTLFQCLWNTCWWYDCPSLQSHTLDAYYASERGLPLDYVPLNRQTDRPGGGSGHLFMEQWRQNKLPNTVWIESLRPPSIRLGEASVSLRGPRDEVWSVASSPDGRTVVCGVADGKIFIWDLPSGRLRLSFKAYDGSRGGVRNLEFLSDGQSFASDAEEGVRFWDASGGFRLSGEDGRVTSYRKKRLATFAQIATFEKSVRSEFGDLSHLLAISSDGRHAALANDQDGVLRIIATSNHNEVGRFDLDACAATFSPDCKLLAAAGAGGEHVLWDVANRAVADKNQILYGHGEIVSSMRFSPDGQLLAVLCDPSGAVNILSVDSLTSFGSRSLAHRDAVTSVAFLPGDGLVVTGSLDGSVMVWNPNEPGRDITMAGHSSAIRKLAFSADGKRIVTWARDETLVWDTETGRLISSIDDPPARGSTTGIDDPPANGSIDGLVAWSDSLETTIEELSHSAKVAWFPASLGNVTRHRSRPIWVGSQSKDLYILELKGDFATEGVVHAADALPSVGLLLEFEDFREIGGAIADLDKAGYSGRHIRQFELVVKATGTGELPAIIEALGRFRGNFRFVEPCTWDP